jgi:peptidyl-prolyl cis-trans isomerase SurA
MKPQSTALSTLIILLCAGGLTAGATAAERKPAAAASTKAAPAPAGSLFGGQTAPRPGFLSQVPPQADPGSERSKLVDEVAAVVNTSVVTRKEMLDRAALMEQQMRSTGRAVPSRADLLGNALESLILERVQQQAAQEAGIRVTDQELDRSIAQIAQQNSVSVDEMRRQIEASGMPFEKYRTELRREIQVSRFRDREIEGQVQVYDGEIDNFLAERRGTQASGPEEYNLAHILVRVAEDASPAQKAEARTKAENLLRQAKSGADFAQLASQSDAAEAAQGGQLGFRQIGRLPAVFANAVLDLAPGQVGDRILETPAGLHIVKLVSKRQANSDLAGVTVPQTRARHILIRTGPQMQEAEARRQLENIRDRVKLGGGDFAAAARQYSQDGSAQAGGDLGWVSPGELVPAFEQAMAKLGPGDVSDPVVTQFGVHLIQVMERREGALSPEKQRDFARASIRAEKMRTAQEDWLRQLRSNAYVEYRVNRQR